MSDQTQQAVILLSSSTTAKNKCFNKTNLPRSNDKTDSYYKK